MQNQPNQKHRQIMGVGSMNPTDGHDSASRKQMYLSSHLSQCLVINGSTERRIQTGQERDFGKYTFSIKMPADGTIVKVIDRYRESIGQDSIALNPQSIVIYENSQTYEFDIIDVPRYHSLHQHFGFKYKPTPIVKNIHRGVSLKKGTVLFDSPAVNERGGYQYGREFNVAFMSHPSAAEDAVIICRDVLKHLSFKTYETRIVEFGSNYFPLFLYGDENNPKIFPEIGDYIRPDNILIALRKHSYCTNGVVSHTNALSVADMNIYDLKKVDNVFDRVYYGAGPGGRVVDIRIFHDPNNSSGLVPTGMEEQAKKYDNATRAFYRELLDEYNRLKRERGEHLKISPAFHRLLVEAIAVAGGNEAKIRKEFKKNPLDEWRIEFVLEYDIVPDIGFKLTDCHGGKGVICRIAEPHEMPVDAAGNRADIIMDDRATIDRMNIGRLYEQFINAASRDLVINLNSMIQAGGGAVTEENPMFNPAWDKLMEYYSLISTRMTKHFTSPKMNRVSHLSHVLKDGIYLYIPPDNEIAFPDMVRGIRKKFMPVRGPVTYTGLSGVPCTTVNNVFIGSVYIILLEKTGDDWTAVSSGVLQHFGVLGAIPKSLKYTKPVRMQPVRAMGESETRIYVSYAGPDITADILDRNNSAVSHTAMVEAILDAEKPTNIEKAINRKIYPLGGSKPLQIFKHILQCSGRRFVFNKAN